MASIMRPTLLRQTALVAASRPTATAVSPACSFTQQAMRSALKDSSRAATFHTTARRSLLPPGPRECFVTPPTDAAISPLTFVLRVSEVIKGTGMSAPLPSTTSSMLSRPWPRVRLSKATAANADFGFSPL